MAASYQMSPPEAFNFKKPEEWPKWIRRFQRFRIASGLMDKSDETQVNTLVYSMGDEADDVMRSFKFDEGEVEDFETVKGKFEAFFVKRRNVIYERAQFNLRKQEEGETVAAFINDLYVLVEHCGFGDLQDEMIRDRLVVGLRDSKLSERLQLDADLTLEKAITITRQSETVHNQQSQMRHDTIKERSIPVNLVNTKKKPTQPSKRQTIYKNASQRCSRCGRTPLHEVRVCPAKEAICRGCGKRGHFQKMCRSARISEVRKDSDNDSDSIFLGVVTSQTNRPWTVSLGLNCFETEFCIDTGAEVTAIPDRVYSQIGKPELQASARELRGPDNFPLETKGRFIGVLRKGDKMVEEEIYVIRGLHKPLLGRPAIEKMDILARIGTVVGSVSQSVINNFSHLFRGLGKLDGDYTIRLKEEARPFSLSTPRRVPIPLMKPVKQELDRMVKLGVISPVTEPTEWCAGMVPVVKRNGSVRVCVDLTHLNQSVKRERHQLPSVEQVLAQLTGARIFSKLDANSGFWQIPLALKSARLTTFITPFGRYQFHRLPFGITSAPEHFQRRMSEILYGAKGVVCMMDDILVFGENQKEHDDNLKEALKRIEMAGLTLNRDKCEFSKDQKSFLGQVIDRTGVHPDGSKVSAIKNVPIPNSVTEVRRFLGMANQLSKFIPNLSDVTEPLRKLLLKDCQWTWGCAQQEAFDKVKSLLVSAPALAIYDPNATTLVSADASSYGLGAVLLQEQTTGETKPVAYISRSLTPVEERYAQIEKEALAFTWACERFSDFLIGINFCIHTDHKPLVPLFTTKRLEELPARVQRFRIRMLRFQFSIIHVPGKQLEIADTLSRAPEQVPNEQDLVFQRETTAFIDFVTQSLPATEGRLKEIEQEQKKDSVCSELAQYCIQGWPPKSSVSEKVKQYYPVASEISIVNGLLMRNSRIIIPASLQQQVLQQIHRGHLGLVKCRLRARQSVWWPLLSQQIQEMVEQCTSCCEVRRQNAEPMIATKFPELPWQKLGMDLFELDKSTYLLVVDYYSRFIEIAKLSTLTSEEVVQYCKSIFARHGIPEEVITDNGPQFVAQRFADFAQEYHFQHITSSPYYPRSNGEAERAVGTIKSLLRKESDPYQALLAYRVTPLSNGYSPCQLLMGRMLRSTLPSTREARKPSTPNRDSVTDKEERQRKKQEENYNRRYRARELPLLLPGDTVWMSDRREHGIIGSQVGPRSYDVTTPTGSFRRNRRNLINIPQPRGSSGTPPANPDQSLDSPLVSDNTDRPNGSKQETDQPIIRRSTRITSRPDRYDPCAT